MLLCKISLGGIICWGWVEGWLDLDWLSSDHQAALSLLLLNRTGEDHLPVTVMSNTA